MARENDEFHSDIDKIFESYLKVGEKPIIRIMKDGRILTKMPYSKVLFDSELNIYKRNDDDSITPVNDPTFKAVVISEV